MDNSRIRDIAVEPSGAQILAYLTLDTGVVPLATRRPPGSGKSTLLTAPLMVGNIGLILNVCVPSGVCLTRKHKSILKLNPKYQYQY